MLPAVLLRIPEGVNHYLESFDKMAWFLIR